MLTQISKIIAITAEPEILLGIAIFISIILYLKNQKSKAILLATTSMIGAAIIKILKETIKAPRPTTALMQETTYAFPSGHTTFAIIFFGLLTYIFSKTKKQQTTNTLLTSLIVIIIALSRLQLQVHSPIDIIGGLLIGTTILLTSIFIHKKLSN